ncbi:MAG: hypothetical protein QM756_37080 [Polyangiaceae bacterium]
MHPLTRTLAPLAFLALGLVSTRATAQDYTHRSFLASDGHFEITGEPARPQIVRVDVSDRPPRAVSLAPHFYWGVSDHVTIGITHRQGVCLGGCGNKVYNDVGFGLLVGLSRSRGFELDINTGVQARSLDPFHIGWKGGLIGRISGERVAFVFDPSVYLGLNRRAQGNGDELVLPFWVYIQATPVVVPFVGAMVVGPLDAFADRVSVPVEGGVLFRIGDRVDLGAYFRFNNLLGRDGGPGPRELGMLGRFRF